MDLTWALLEKLLDGGKTRFSCCRDVIFVDLSFASITRISRSIVERSGCASTLNRNGRTFESPIPVSSHEGEHNRATSNLGLFWGEHPMAQEPNQTRLLLDGKLLRRNV